MPELEGAPPQNLAPLMCARARLPTAPRSPRWVHHATYLQELGAVDSLEDAIRDGPGLSLPQGCPLTSVWWSVMRPLSGVAAQRKAECLLKALRARRFI